MALNINELADFIGRINAPNSAYPFGSAKDETSASAGDGTPYIKARADDVFGMQQSLLTAGGITPNGNPDSVTNPQYLSALSALGWSQYANYPIGARVLRSEAWYQATAASGPGNGGAIDPDLGTVKWSELPSGVTEAGAVAVKTDYDSPSLEVSGSDLQASQDFTIVVNGSGIDVEAGEQVTLPTLSTATDYKVYAATDGTLSAQEYDTAAPANSALVGGFHAAYSDASIVDRSLWDFAWKPATSSPRAMALTLSGRVWADIYKMDTEYGVNGYSRPDAQIADGDSLPLRSLAYGGDGVAAYPDFNSYTAKELAASAGKRLPDHAEFQDYAYGTVTGQVSGTNPDTTKHQAGLRSAIGCEQASGAQWEWGNEIWDRGNGSTGYNWYAADTDIRGEVYAAGASSVGVSRYGGQWDDNGKSGPRCSGWVHEAWDSRPHASARAVCTHTKYGV